MLDETMIVVLGEFGRTVGGLTGAGGRDHLTRMSIALAGGGVRGGTIIGKTDPRVSPSPNIAGAPTATSVHRI